MGKKVIVEISNKSKVSIMTFNKLFSSPSPNQQGQCFTFTDQSLMNSKYKSVYGCTLFTADYVLSPCLVLVFSFLYV